MRFLICLGFSLSFSSLSYGQYKSIKFEHVRADQEISSNVMAILQDSRGFMWFGTRDGFTKYDGYKLTVYKQNIRDTSSISHNTVTDIIEDKEGNLWLATWEGGLNRYDRNKDRFVSYKFDDDIPHPISSNLISSILIDSQENFWIGTKGGGLNLLNRADTSFTYYRHHSNGPGSLSSDIVTKIYEDSAQNLWIGTLDGGLNLFNRKSQTFTNLQYDKHDKQSLSHNYVSEIFEDSQNRLWIGTKGGGLNLLDRETLTFRHFRYSPFSEKTLASDVVLCIAEDEQGVLWIGTENGGISIFDPKTETFQTYKQDGRDNTSLGNNSIYDIYKDDKGNMWIGTFSSGLHFVNIDFKQFTHYKHNSFPHSLSNDNVLCIYEDSKENLWIGTDGGGLNLFDREKGYFYHYKHELGNKNSIAGNHVLRVMEDRQGHLWLGTWGDGVTVFHKEKDTYKHFKHDPENPSSISSNNVWNIYEDTQGSIWLATYSHGLNVYDAKTESFTHFKHDRKNNHSISHNTVNNVFEDSKGRFWVGTKGGGLNLMDRQKQTFTRFTHKEDENSISNNYTSCIFEDSRGNLWIGTEEGLNQLDGKTHKFTNYHQVDGLPHEFIFGMLEDDHGNLWISTKKGLSRYHPQTNTFKNFGVADGLQADEYREAYFKSRTGKMYFGGINGFNEFHPDSVKERVFTPPLVITHFEIFNSDVPIAHHEEEGAILKKHISETNALTLSHEHSVFSFEFASLNYTLPEKKQYAYQLEGFDQSWNYVGTKHTATYTNLDPGSYIFKVKGLDNQGNWSKETAHIQLTITPPFWQTWWFRVASVLFVMSSLATFFHVRMRVIHHQKQALERQVKERTEQLESLSKEERVARIEAEKARREAEQANRAKSVFLATMSHEIRTPMNGVMGMTSLLEETSLTQEQQEYTTTIRSSSESLLTVINDILDFSKIESGRMELEDHDFNLRHSIEDILDLFAAKASANGMDLVLHMDRAIPTQVIGDALRLRQILMNLVGNAIKFTEKGEVCVIVRLLGEREGTLELGFEVKDSGIGIPTEKIERLFHAFSQVDSSTTRKYGGSGLGLVICEKLIEMMGGQIQVKSQEGVGSSFTFTIQIKPGTQNTHTLLLEEAACLKAKRILIVDDNTAVREMLSTQLSEWEMLPQTAGSLQQAMKLLEEDSNFDLVMMDGQMQDTTEHQSRKKISQQNFQIPLIFLHPWGNRIEGTPEPYTSVLYKPIRQQVLYTHLLNVFKHTKAPQETGNEVKLLSDRLVEQYPLNILVAEDNLVNQKLAIRVLEKLGYTPDLAKNGREAVDAVSQKQYDIIFMDVQMPEMDGLEATREIRKNGDYQPVIIALTANAMQGDREACLNAQMDDYLHKPFKLEELVHTLKQWAVKLSPEKEHQFNQK